MQSDAKKLPPEKSGGNLLIFKKQAHHMRNFN